MSTLQADSLSVSYGGVHALSSVSITLESGSAVGLIGPNGAGKTSFLDGLTGLTPATGRVILDGRDISHLPAYRRARLGLRRTWQSVHLFDDLTVGENLCVSADPPERRAGLLRFGASQRAELRSRAVEALNMFGLGAYVDAMPKALPLGAQKLVGVARALVARPSVVGLDEPAAGLDRVESREFGRHLRSVVAAGVAVLLIDHDMDLVLNVCDHVYVLDFGSLIAQGTGSEIRSDERVLAAYLGGDAPEPSPGADPAPGQSVAGKS